MAAGGGPDAGAVWASSSSKSAGTWGSSHRSATRRHFSSHATSLWLTAASCMPGAEKITHSIKAVTHSLSKQPAQVDSYAWHPCLKPLEQALGVPCVSADMHMQRRSCLQQLEAFQDALLGGEGAPALDRGLGQESWPKLNDDLICPATLEVRLGRLQDLH